MVIKDQRIGKTNPNISVTILNMYKLNPPFR